MCTLVLLHTCLGQRECTGVDCPRLDHCIEEVLESGACCSTCLLRGCTCEGYQYYDCIRGGFKNGKVPEGRSYLVDSGSTECYCPAGGGRIGCRFIPCPDVPPHCIELSDLTETCPHCLRIGCIYKNQKYEAGHSFHMDPCQVCHCPNDGGDLMCSEIPDCSTETVKNPEETENEVHTSKHENPEDLPVKGNTFPSNSVPIYTKKLSEFEESEDYDDYYPETTTSPDAFITTSVDLQVQNPHDVLHEYTRKELRETLGTYSTEPRDEGAKNSLNLTTVKTDSRSSEKLSSHTKTIIGHTQVPSRGTTSSTSDGIRRPEDDKNLQHMIPELTTVPKLQFISTISPPEDIRELEDHREPKTLGRYHQESNEHPVLNQRGKSFNMKRFCSKPYHMTADIIFAEMFEIRDSELRHILLIP